MSSEAEEELSLMEYIHRKQDEENSGPKKKRVSYVCLVTRSMDTLTHSHSHTHTHTHFPGEVG